MSSIPPAERGAAAVALASSRYGFAIPVRDGTLLYHAGSGAVIRLAGGDAGRIADCLAGPPQPIAPEEWPPELVLQLIEGGSQHSSRALPVLSPQPDTEVEDRGWWNAFDPTVLPTCRRCSFLPVCWAGCPKRHLDRDSHVIAEQGAYWRRNLARLVADGVREELVRPVIFDEASQFRD
jgi:hypothetical protein